MQQSDARRSQDLRCTQTGVIGGGTMGAGIAICFALAGMPVILIEVDQAALGRAATRIDDIWAISEKRGTLSAADRIAARARITFATDMAALSGADLVIEAVIEDIALKADIFARLSSVVGPQAILATNTSYLDIDRIAAAASNPQRVVGMHFFSPANVMKLVEVIRGKATDPAVLERIVQTATAIDKIPVVVGNCHGFVGNRMLARRTEQVERLLLEGALPGEIDAAFTSIGARLGPCAMGDLAGLDIGWRMRQATGKVAPVADALVADGRLGQKAGKGYYSYPDGARKPVPAPEVATLIEGLSLASGITRRTLDADEMLDRMLLPMVNEGARILDEGIAASAADIDLIWRHGYGFPPGLGGPMRYAQDRGLPEVVERLERFAAQSGDTSLIPAALLRELARTGAGFAGLEALG